MIQASFKISILLFIFSSLIFPQNIASKRFIAVTFDDLPINSRYLIDGNQWVEQTEKLLAHLKKYKVPAVGFVNENKLYVNAQLDSSRLKVLKMWIDADFDLGNHTFSHPDYNKIDNEIFFNDIIRGEKIIKELLTSKNKTLRYFSYPYLHLGNTQEKKDALENFLEEHSYITAPVTIDNGEWIYAFAYEKAYSQNDSELMKKIGTEYISYMINKIIYFEKQSVKLFGHEIKQILLVHSNLLNAEYFDELAAEITQRNYSFISLSEALTDSAYNSEDNFIGEGGISWLHRWSYTKKVDKSFFDREPEVSKFILDIAGVDSE